MQYEGTLARVRQKAARVPMTRLHCMKTTNGDLGVQIRTLGAFKFGAPAMKCWVFKNHMHTHTECAVPQAHLN